MNLILGKPNVHSHFYLVDVWNHAGNCVKSLFTGFCILYHVNLTSGGKHRHVNHQKNIMPLAHLGRGTRKSPLLKLFTVSLIPWKLCINTVIISASHSIWTNILLTFANAKPDRKLSKAILCKLKIISVLQLHQYHWCVIHGLFMGHQNTWRHENSNAILYLLHLAGKRNIFMIIRCRKHWHKNNLHQQSATLMQNEQLQLCLCCRSSSITLQTLTLKARSHVVHFWEQIPQKSDPLYN